MTTPFPDPLPSGLFIDGTWRDAADGSTLDVLDPATEEVFAQVAHATRRDVDAALAAAEDGYRRWRSTDPWTRSATVRRIADVLRAWCQDVAFVLTSEQGKPLAEAEAEVLAAADQFDWYADEARRLYGRTLDARSSDSRLFVRREPVGVVAALSTWNFPALLPSRKLAPALAAGCSVVLKPAEEAPVTGLLLAEACARAGVPAGVVNVVTGDPAAISAQLVRAPGVRKVSLTGSVPVGQTVLRDAADGVKSVSMELGGHAPVLVFADADMEKAAQACVRAKFRNAGQVCASPSRFYVQHEAVSAFAGAFADAANRLTVGDGRVAGTDVGPMTSAGRVTAAEELVADAVDMGARVTAGGGRHPAHDRGYFFQPTVLTDATADMRLMVEEPFAPVAPIVSFADLDDALARANDTDLGLASYVFTSDLRTAFLASEGLEAGMVGVNTMQVATAEAPFGGVKRSGFGREGGSEGIDDYVVTKCVNLAL